MAFSEILTISKILFVYVYCIASDFVLQIVKEIIYLNLTIITKIEA